MRCFIGSCLSRTLVGDSLLLCNVVNWANQMGRLYVCQYVVFILKIILSYLPVHLINSLPSSPLKRVAVVELRWEGERQLGLPGWAARRTLQATFILYLE